MSCEIIIRQARSEDAFQRAELVHIGFLSHQWNAFIYFLFQELTLQAVLLAGAVLFIFVGVSPTACLALVPLAAAVVAAAVTITHHSLAYAHKQRVAQEQLGLVAEARGPLALGAPARPVPVRLALHHPAQPAHPTHCKLVGTVSVSEFRGPRPSLWLHELSVDPEWRRCGVARALVSAARHLSASAARASLETLTSDLQTEARTLLHSQGWECRATYERPLLGPALTLPVARLGVDLPHA